MSAFTIPDDIKYHGGREESTHIDCHWPPHACGGTYKYTQTRAHKTNK